MDLISWSLNAIDTIFSTRTSGIGEAQCPDGTFASGYIMDPWGKWSVLCLAVLSLEDVEDLYLFGVMVVGLLLLGLGGALNYRLIWRLAAGLEKRLPEFIAEVGKSANGQTTAIMELLRRVDSISERLAVLQASVDRHLEGGNFR